MGQPNTLWDAPPSPHDLIQWHVRNEPWRVLVACVFCNLTRRLTAEPLFWEFLARWPTPEAASKADERDIQALIQPLGLSFRRAKTLRLMSEQYLRDDWNEPRELHGIGNYAQSAWDIFVLGKWKEISRPNDHALAWYYDWLWENHA
jgi:methyl-CpG-binding domain protein 4